MKIFRFLYQRYLVFKNFILEIVLLLLLFWFILPSFLFCQSQWVTINPGVKLGYQFGDQSGFIVGGEISYVIREDKEPSYYGGVVLSVDYCRGLLKYHAGIEGGEGFWGICIGPSYLSKNGENDFGFTVTPYIGALLIPYVSSTFSSKFGSNAEVGSYIKIPMLVSGRYYWSD